MTLLAGIVVVACGLCLIGFACIVFVTPAPAKQFLTLYAVGVFAFGSLLLYGALVGGSRGAP